MWVHACSVGEVGSVAALVERLLAHGEAVHLTVITETGYAHAKRLFGEKITVSHLPLDLPGFFARFLQILRPKLLLLVETEFWPGMLRACRRRGVPVVGVNTRISPRAFPKYRRTRWLWRWALAGVACFFAQSEADAERLKALGVDERRIQVVGNLKFAAPAPEVDAAALRARFDPWGTRLVFLAGSTHAGEEAMLARVVGRVRVRHPELLFVVVPRHPERFDEAEAEIAKTGLSVRRWQEQATVDDVAVLVDAMGVLAGLYFACDLAFVGGSLVPIGGHNPLEPARAGRGVLSGPHVENFAEVYAAMQWEGAAIVVPDEKALGDALMRLIEHPEERAAFDARARRFAQRQGAALDRIWETVSRYL